MDKEKYQKAIAAIDSKIKSFGELRKSIRATYIKQNAPIPVGSKIILHMPEHRHRKRNGELSDVEPPCDIAVIVGGYKDNNGDLTEILYKVKKDGMKSSERFKLSDYPVTHAKDRSLKWKYAEAT